MQVKVMKYFILLVTIFGMVQQAMAEDYFKFPKFTNILKVESKGVNVRRQPSLQAVKLTTNPQLLLLLDETDEWYHVAVVKDEKLLATTGYVSKKVKVSKTPNINSNYVKNAFGEQGIEIYGRMEGMFKGWSIISFRFFSLGWERKYLFIGKRINNGAAYVGKLLYYCDNDRNYFFDVEGMGDADEEGEPAIIPIIQLGEYMEPDFSKLTDGDIKSLLKKGSFDTVTVLYADQIAFEYRNGIDDNTVESGSGIDTTTMDVGDYQGDSIMY